MGNPVKYSDIIPANALKKGQVAFGVNNVNYGPTAETGWYADAVEGSYYQIYETIAPDQAPRIYSPSNENELVRLANSKGGNVTNEADALEYFGTLPTFLVVNFSYENIVTDGLVLDLDAGIAGSYPTKGTAFYDLSGNGDAQTISSGVGFQFSGSDFDGSSTLVFDGTTNDYVNFYAPNLGGTATVEMWCKIGAGYSSKMFCGWLYYDVYCANGTIGYNTGNSDVYGISQATVNSLGIVGQWAHYIFEFRSDVSYTNNKIYINGVSQTLSQQLGNESQGNRSFNSGNGRIASWLAGGYYMPMDCAVFRVYNRSLTQAEVTQNYNAFKGRYQNFFTNGNFQFLTAGGALQNFTNGATANSTTKLPGYNYSCQITLPQYSTFYSDNYIQVDTSKTYVMTVKNRTLTKGGPGNNVLSGGHTGFITYDSSGRFIDLRNCGDIANTVLTRDLNPGDAYAYVSNTNQGQWYPANSTYYFRHFCLYPPSHPEYNKPWEYTRIGYGDYNIFYNEITDIGGGELRFRFADASGNWTTFPNIGYPTPSGTAVMNGVAGGTYSYVFYPTEAPYDSWATYTSAPFTGENRNSGTPFRYATKYITFMHLVNYAVPGGTSPLPVMLFGDVTLEQVK